MLVYLAGAGAVDRDYIERHTSGFEDALTQARRFAGSAAMTARATGLSEPDVAAFFRMFAKTPRVVTLYSQGVNQSAQGTDKVNAILNCHLATGRIGRPGASPFSLTGHPMRWGAGSRRSRQPASRAYGLYAWGYRPCTPVLEGAAYRHARGAKGGTDVRGDRAGEIKALWVMGTNPAVSLPDADAVRAALAKLELFVVPENVRSNDTVNAGARRCCRRRRGARSRGR